jgi:transformation/transcription domain-associated protein
MELLAQKLRDGDIAVQLKAAADIKDQIDMVNTAEYPQFLQLILPIMIDLLNRYDCKLNLLMLEIIHRCPHNDYLKAFAAPLMNSLLGVLVHDNQDNGVLSLKIIVDLHKNYKMLLEDLVPRFLDIVKLMYQNLEKSVQRAFAKDQLDAASEKYFDKSINSFKVLTDCPVIVALLFSLHRRYVDAYVPEFVPLIVNVLPSNIDSFAPASASATGS